MSALYMQCYTLSRPIYVKDKWKETKYLCKHKRLKCKDVNWCNKVFLLTINVLCQEVKMYATLVCGILIQLEKYLNKYLKKEICTVISKVTMGC